MTGHNTVVYGMTAVHARKLAASAGLRMLLAVLTICVTALLAWRLVMSSTGGPRLVLLLVLLPMGLLAGGFANRFQNQYLRASSGVRAEERVAATIVRSRLVSALINGAVFGRGDIDHVVLGPPAAAIETKHGRGPVAVGRDGVLRVGGRVMPRDPLNQAKRNARVVANALNVPITPVLVIVDANTPPQRIDGVLVCSRKDLPNVLRSLPAVVGDAHARTLAARIPVAKPR